MENMKPTGTKRRDMAENQSYDGPSTSKKIMKPDLFSKEENKEKTDAPNNEETFTAGASLSRFKRIPIFVVHYHNDVLALIFEIFRKGYLPLENNTLLHFDAHPDMAISHIPASYYTDNDKLLTYSCVESWIMPLLYNGQFNKVVWVKNSWCNQMPVGKHTFKVGERKGQVRVDWKLDYFRSVGKYCRTSKLQQGRDIELQVVNADTNDVPNPKELLSGSNATNYILDIDLSFFSAANPFFKASEKLAEIFKFDRYPEESKRRARKRRRFELDALADVFLTLQVERSVERVPPNSGIPVRLLNELKLFENLLKSPPDSIWGVAYEYGCLANTNGVSHHISTEDELNFYYKRFKEFVINLPHPPVVVTIAFSNYGDFGGPENHYEIGCKVIGILFEVFGDKIHEKTMPYYIDADFDLENW